jgi:hypothetical protein
MSTVRLSGGVASMRSASGWLQWIAAFRETFASRPPVTLLLAGMAPGRM